MPARSGRQYRAMAAAAHDDKAAKKMGIPQATAKEFVKKTPRDKRKAWAKKK